MMVQKNERGEKSSSLDVPHNKESTSEGDNEDKALVKSSQNQKEGES